MSEFKQRGTSASLEQIDALIDEIRAAMLPAAATRETDAPRTATESPEYWRASFAKLENGIKNLVDAATGGTLIDGATSTN